MYQALDPGELRGSVLIAAPHPDDDILACGGLIQEAAKRGTAVYILYMTAGDGSANALKKSLRLPRSAASYIRLGFRRYQEAVEAAALLGVPRHRLFFLCFPDGVMARILKPGSADRPVRSPRTGLTRAEYPFAYSPRTPYTCGSAIRLIRQIVRLVQPGTVIVSHAADTHPDHRATRKLVLTALRDSRRPTDVYSALVHYPSWPSLTGAFAPPAKLRSPRLRRLVLSPAAAANKKAGFRLHKSQYRINRYMLKLLRSAEFFWKETIDIPSSTRNMHDNVEYLFGIAKFPAGRK